MEQKYLIGCIKSRHLYEALVRVGYEEHLSDLGRIVFKLFKEYYENDKEATCIDKDLLNEVITRKFPKHQETIQQALKGSEDDDVSIPNLLEGLIEARRYQLQGALGEACWSHNSKSIQDLIYQLQELERYSEDDDSNQSAARIPLNNLVPSDIISSVDDSHRLRIYPLKLNSLVGGGALPGHHIVVYGVPDAGKTTFTLNMVRGFLKDGHKVLYIANEEPARVLLQRIIQSILGITKEQFLNNEIDLGELNGLGYRNFFLYHSDGVSIHDIDEFAGDINPDVIVVDQIKNIYGGSKDGNMVLDLESVAKKVRAIGLRYDAVTVSVTQAADSATNKAVLDQGDVYYSNTGIPGTADLMIGIGMNKSMYEEGKRMVSFPKCKLIDHPVAPILVEMNPAIVRVR